jgi:hypothetical protein
MAQSSSVAGFIRPPISWIKLDKIPKSAPGKEKQLIHEMIGLPAEIEEWAARGDVISERGLSIPPFR